MTVMCTKSFQYRGTMIFAGHTIEVSEEELKKKWVAEHVGAVDKTEIWRHANAGAPVKDETKAKAKGEAEVKAKGEERTKAKVKQDELKV